MKTTVIDNERIKEQFTFWKFTLDDDDIGFNDPHYVESLKKEYQGVFYERFIRGEFVIADGLVYPNFEKCVIPTENRPYTEYQVSCDYGTDNPCVFLLWGKFSGIWYLIKEYYYSSRKERRQKTDDEYYSDLEEFTAGIPVKRIIADPSALSFITMIRRRGRFVCIGADHDVLQGIRTAATAISTEKIKVNDCCTNTVAESNAYAWCAKSGEDKPMKENDHAMDALRYFVYTNQIGRPPRKSLLERG